LFVIIKQQLREGLQMALFGTTHTNLTTSEKLDKASIILFRTAFYSCIIILYYNNLYAAIALIAFFGASIKIGLEMRRMVQLFKNLKIDD